MDEKVEVDRLRRVARRQGLYLMKSRRRDPRAPDFGRFHLIRPESNIHVAENLTLDQVRKRLEPDGRLF